MQREEEVGEHYRNLVKSVIQLLSSDCRGSNLDLLNVMSSLALAFHLLCGVSSRMCGLSVLSLTGLVNGTRAG